MIRKFDDFSVQAKLATIFMVICSFLVLLMGFLFVVDKVISFRHSMVETHSMLAESIAKNSTAALVFDDVVTAREVLSALKVARDVETATIFTADGKPFASYAKNAELGAVAGSRTGAISPQLIPLSDKGVSYQFRNNYLLLSIPIMLEDKRYGSLSLRANLKHLNQRLLASIVIVIVLIVILGLLAQLVSVRLHRFIARPLIGLLETMDAVKVEKNYSYRVDKLNNDEFGELTDGFNSMLVEIEKREEELRNHKENLEVLVEKRTKELVLANQRLKIEAEERKVMQDKLARSERMEAIGTLAAGVAHDLNNILSGVISYPELLLMRLDKNDELYEPMITILNSGKKAAAIVQDLLTLSRRKGAMVESVDLLRVIEDYLASTECQNMLSENPNVTIFKEIDTEVAAIQGSPLHLKKTIMNLVTNSVEAIESEGVITLSLSRCYLDRAIHGYKEIIEGDYIHLQVRDTGHGISEEDLKFIFEPFYTRKKMGLSGTGLGMAVVWGTVQDHKGYIDVVSRPKEGATFDLYFPASSEEAAATEIVDLNNYKGRGENILVVDDVKEQRIIASEILTELGYVVEAVASGEEAVIYLHKKTVDLLLLDMIMDPGIDGIETYRQVLEINPRQRALIASGYSEANRVEVAKKLGIVFLQKPYQVARLAKLVREELDRRVD